MEFRIEPLIWFVVFSFFNCFANAHLYLIFDLETSSFSLYFELKCVHFHSNL